MNLEQLKQQLYNIAENLYNNNLNHFRINEDLLSTPPPLESVAKEATHQEGILADLEYVVGRIAILVREQEDNIGRTNILIKDFDNIQTCASPATGVRLN